MLIGGLTLGLGILAVLGAVIYRTFTAIPPVTPNAIATPAAPVTDGRLTLADMGLPADARLTSTATEGSRLVLTYGHGGGNTVILVDTRRMAVVGRLELPGGP
jgi:hypothetical protein